MDLIIGMVRRNRASQRRAGMRVNGGIGSVELLEFEIWKRRPAGRWADTPVASNLRPRVAFAKMSVDSATKRHPLSLRLDETALVGAGN